MSTTNFDSSPEQRGDVVHLLSAAERDLLAFDSLSTQTQAPALKG